VWKTFTARRETTKNGDMKKRRVAPPRFFLRLGTGLTLVAVSVLSAVVVLDTRGALRPFRPPLSVLLSNMVRRSPVLSVHFRNHSVKGWLVAQGGDFAVLGRRGDQHLVIPLESIEWFEVL